LGFGSTFGFGACFVAAVVSPKRSSSSAAGSGLFYSFFSGFAAFFPLKAL